MNNQERQQRRYVAQMAERLRRGLMDRRDFIRAAAMAGFGFANARYLGGGGASSAVAQEAAATVQVADEATGSTAAQQAFLKEVGGRFRGTRIRVISENTPAGIVIRKLMQDEFMRLTGIEVDWELLPLDQVLAKTIQDTLLGEGGEKGHNDVFYWDQAWLGRFANDSTHLDELLDKKDLAYPDYCFDDFMPQLVQSTASYREEIVGVPFDIPIFIMMYRRDLFEELKLSVPKTLSDYLNVVKTIHEAKHGQGIHGTVGQWKTGHYSLQSETSSWLWAHGGHHFNSEERPDYLNDANRQGLHFMMELGKYMDPACRTWDWDGQAKAFASGSAGVMISWNEFFPDIDNPATSRVAGLVEPTDCPREDALLTKAECGFGETPGISRQGGSCLALSKHAPNHDAAWIFMQWATSAEVAARANAMGADTPTRASCYSDPLILEKRASGAGTTRHFEVTRRAIETRMGTAPHMPAWPDLAIRVNASELGKLTNGQQSVEQTLQAIQDKTEKYLAEHKS
jgi:multiple sugar transport system substrate-binding protein